MPNKVYLGFRMRQLPRAEYRLMQAMIKRYQLQDPCELFTCLLRLTYEIIHMQNAGISDGHKYLIQIIDLMRSHIDEVRIYELPGALTNKGV